MNLQNLFRSLFNWLVDIRLLWYERIDDWDWDLDEPRDKDGEFLKKLLRFVNSLLILEGDDAARERWESKWWFSDSMANEGTYPGWARKIGRAPTGRVRHRPQCPKMASRDLTSPVFWPARNRDFGENSPRTVCSARLWSHLMRAHRRWMQRTRITQNWTDVICRMKMFPKQKSKYLKNRLEVRFLDKIFLISVLNSI